MAIISRSHLQTRLQAILGSLDRGASAGDAPLYTKQFGKESQLSLVAVFDNGIDPDPRFSGPVMGRLFIDSDHNLTLATWPLGKDSSPLWRKETLLTHVESFEFEFLGGNQATKHGKKEKRRAISANYAWHTQLAQSELHIPSLVRLSILEKKNSQPLQFAFILPSPEPYVTYRGKKT